VPKIGDVSPALREPRATFVTLRHRDSGELRGCRGEYVARRPLVESVIHMTVVSATDDPRFQPVDVHEVAGLHIEISALTAPQPIEPADVVVGRHGLVIRKGTNAGLLLPQVPLSHGWDQEQYLDALCWKARMPAGAWRDADVELQAFEAEVWGEED
jgi:AmmeMemoRadiSam system protein A